MMLSLAHFRSSAMGRLSIREHAGSRTHIVRHCKRVPRLEKYRTKSKSSSKVLFPAQVFDLTPHYSNSTAIDHSQHRSVIENSIVSKSLRLKNHACSRLSHIMSSQKDLKALGGKWSMNKDLSSDVSPVLEIQGFNAVMRKAVSYAPVNLSISQPSDSEIQIKQSTTANIPAIDEEW